MLKSNDTDDIIYVGNDGKSSSEYSGDSLPVFAVLVQKESVYIWLVKMKLFFLMKKEFVVNVYKNITPIKFKELMERGE